MNGRSMIGGLIIVWSGVVAGAYTNLGCITQGEWIEIGLMGSLIVVTSFYAFSASRQAKDTRNLVRASLDAARLEHNWKLFEHKVDPGLPELPSPTDPKNQDYWKWRIVHLNHLNLLHTQWISYKSKTIGKEELKGWIDWAHLLLKEIKRDREEAIKKLKSGQPDYKPGTREILKFNETSPRLKALLHISELHNWDLFPHDYVGWLLEKCGFNSLHLSNKQ